MTKTEQERALVLLDLAKSRLEKSGWEFSATWSGFSLSAHSSGGKGWRPDPLAFKTDKINRQRPTQKELQAWKIVCELSDVQFDCLFIWHCIRNQIKPGTQDRYRLGDLLAVLTYKYYSAVSIGHGCMFLKPSLISTQKEAIRALASKYEKVFPPIREKTSNSVSAGG